MQGISGIGKFYLSNDPESKIQILLTLSMMRLCWPVTHFFSRSIESVCRERGKESFEEKDEVICFKQVTDKFQEEKDDIKELKCLVCEGKHDLDNCKQFNNMSVDERSKMLREKKIMLWLLPPSISRAYCQDLQEKEGLQNMCNEASNWIAWVCTAMES